MECSFMSISLILCQIINAFYWPIFYRVADSKRIKMPVLIFYDLAFSLISNILLAHYPERQYSKEKLLNLGRKEALIILIYGLLGVAMPLYMYVWSFSFASTKLASMCTTLIAAFIIVLNVIVRKVKPSTPVVGAIVMLITSDVIVYIMNEGPLAAKSSPLSSTTLSVVVGILLFTISSTILATWLTNRYIQENLDSELANSSILGTLVYFVGTLVSMTIAVCFYHDREDYGLGVKIKWRIIACCVS